MTGIDTSQVIARECPSYPQPSRSYDDQSLRCKILIGFQEDVESAAAWLIVDSLKAALDYIEWLKANITAADNEMHGIYAHSEERPDPYDISSFLKAKEQIRNVMEGLRQ